MKKWYFLSVLFLLIGQATFSQIRLSKKNKQQQQQAQPNVRQYWFVLLTTGPNQEADSATKAGLFNGHMANIGKLYQKGILKVAGPFGDNNNNWRGIFIFDCASLAEAEGIVKTDPAIAAGLLKAEITPWYTTPVDSFKPGPPQIEEPRSAFEE